MSLIRAWIVLMVCVALVTEVRAQWTRTAGGALADVGWGVTTDADGNIYQAGSFQGTATFGETTLEAKSSSDRFIAKYTAGGENLWVRAEAGARNNASLIVDQQGRIFVTEGFWTDVRLGDTTFASRGLIDHLLVKYSPEGERLWFTHIGGSELEGIFGMAADEEGGVYITGGFFRQTVVGSNTLDGNGLQHTIYLAKFDAAGRLEWVDLPGSTCGDWPSGLSADDEGNVYLAGSVGCEGTFGSHVVPAGAVFVAKYRRDGSVDWATSAAQSHTESHYVNGMTVWDGRVFLVSTFIEQVDFGSTILSSPYGESMYVAAFTSTGDFAWATQVGDVDPENNTVQEQGRGITVDAQGGPVVFGRSAVFQTDLDPGYSQYFVARFDAEGRPRWTRTVGGRSSGGIPNSVELWDIAADEAGYVLLSGTFAGTVELRGDTLISNGASDIFLTQMSIESATPVEPSPPVPAMVLAQNLPNPFHASTEITFHVPSAGPVSLVVYDVRGREVARLIDRWMVSGSQRAVFDASALPSGVYLYRLTSGRFSQTKRMVHLR